MGNFGLVASLLAATLYQENTDYGKQNVIFMELCMKEDPFGSPYREITQVKCIILESIPEMCKWSIVYCIFIFLYTSSSMFYCYFLSIRQQLIAKCDIDTPFMRNGRIVCSLVSEDTRIFLIWCLFQLHWIQFCNLMIKIMSVRCIEWRHHLVLKLVFRYRRNTRWKCHYTIPMNCKYSSLEIILSPKNLPYITEKSNKGQ